MIRIVFFKWTPPYQYRSVFTGEQVEIARDMIARNTTVEHEIVLITDNMKDVPSGVRAIPLWENPAPQYGGHMKPNCFVRLKAFAEEMKDVIGEEFIWSDLDMAVVGNIDHILTDPAEFKIWRPDGEKMPCNGSLVKMKAGARARIWNRFDPKQVDPHNSFRRTTGFVGSDQAWIAQNLTKDDQFFEKKDGIYSFRCHIVPKNEGALPPQARIVFFHGERDPWDEEVRRKWPWIRQHYRSERHEPNRIALGI